MTELNHDTDSHEEQENTLSARLDRLEQENLVYRQVSENRAIRAEMKVHALRAGIVDLDGLRFLDLKDVHIADDGNVVEAGELINQLKRAKPWLFAHSSSSSLSKVPPSKSTQPKLATDMTNEEYQVARAAIIRRATP